MKYADDIAILSRLCKDMDLTSYPSEINTFIQWCDKNCLVLNVKKTQEMVLDPRSVSEHKPVIIKDTMIQQVTSYRYLGFYMDSVLCWKTHIDSLCTRLQQRLYFLRRLRLYGVGSKIVSGYVCNHGSPSGERDTASPRGHYGERLQHDSCLKIHM